MRRPELMQNMVPNHAKEGVKGPSSESCDAPAPEDDEITDYCNQVCGGGNCGPGNVCQYGIDYRTGLPATAEVLAEERKRDSLA